jgi:hypothetical protein
MWYDFVSTTAVICDTFLIMYVDILLIKPFTLVPLFSFFLGVSQRALLNLLYLVEIYFLLPATKPLHIIDLFETFLRIFDGSTMIYKIMAVILSQLHLEKKTSLY